jgi:phenylpropionate dioxygenase-like ring-hydroxylating dioxygenase large terminal subunit
MSLLNNWYIVCRSHELKQKPRPVHLFDTAFVVWRDASGKAHALMDRCPHRNAPLSAGRVEDGCVVCPYHGWKFDGTGTCSHVPSLSDDRPLPNTAVRSLAVCEQDSYVWLCPGTPPKTPPRPFPNCEKPGWTTFHMRTHFAAGVEACLENFLDCPHTATVHRGWFRNPDAREMDAVVRRLPDAVEVKFENEPVTDSWIARLFYPGNARVAHTDRFLMPNISRVDYRFGADHHFIITSQATPLDSDHTEVHTVISFRYGRIGWLVRLLFEPMSRVIIRQDVDILKLQGDNVRRFGGSQYSHVETDLISLHMQSLRRKADRGEPPPEESSEKRIRIRF